MPESKIQEMTGPMVLDFKTFSKKIGLHGPILVHNPGHSIVWHLNTPKEVVNYSEHWIENHVSLPNGLISKRRRR